MSETELKSLDDMRRRSQEDLAARRAGDDRVQRWMQVARRVTWMILLGAALLAYYLLDKMQEAVSLLK